MKAKPAKRTPRPRRPIHATVVRVVVPESGVRVLALVPDHAVDRRAMRERGYGVGVQLRADLWHARNVQFFRLAHALGGFLADHVAGYEGLDQHEALKRLQERSGIGCIVEHFDVPGLGRLTRTVAESLNFARMDEGRWQVLWDGGVEMAHEGGWIGWLREHVFGGLDAMSRDEVERLIDPEPRP